MEKNGKFVCEASAFNSPFQCVGISRCKVALQEQRGRGHTYKALSFPISLEKADAGNSLTMLGIRVPGITQGMNQYPSSSCYAELFFHFLWSLLLRGWYPAIGHTCTCGKVSSERAFFQTHHSCSSWGQVTFWGLSWVGVSFSGDSLEGLGSGRWCLARAAGLRE